jgi:hypothetical protein
MPYFTRIKEMDWVVGFEPTTSASFLGGFYVPKGTAME